MSTRRLKKKSNRRQQQIVQIENPWQVGLSNYNPIAMMRLRKRYVIAVATTPTISSTALLIAGGGVCTVVNTNARCPFLAVKLHRVRLWMQSITSGTAAYAVTQTATLNWGPASGNVFYGASKSQVNATSVGPEEPLYIDSRPPRESNAAGWQQANTDIMFSISGPPSSLGGAAGNLPAGTLIEIDATWVFSDGSANGLALPAFGGITAALGQVVYPSLDNQTSAQCRPIGIGLAV
jgi:hypothetical protein